MFTLTMLTELKDTKHIKDLSFKEVKELQELLVASGYLLAVDGILGSQTTNAFYRFKEQHQLGYPDYIGATTIHYLQRYAKDYHPSRRKINREGLNLIKNFEGYRDTAYLCPSSVWTIGYGSTFYPDGTPVRQGDKITKEEGEQLLLTTVKGFEDAVARGVIVPLTDNQFSALVSFTFNVGVGAFRGSTLRKVLNQKDYLGASNQFLRWTRGGGKVLQGLVKRRQAEKKLFDT